MMAREPGSMPAVCTWATTAYIVSPGKHRGIAEAFADLIGEHGVEEAEQIAVARDPLGHFHTGDFVARGEQEEIDPVPTVVRVVDIRADAEQTTALEAFEPTT